MGIKIKNEIKCVRINTLRPGDLFLHKENVYMVTDGYFGDYADFMNRIVICIENGKCFTIKDIIGNISSFCVEPIHNAQLVIGRTFD